MEFFDRIPIPETPFKESYPRISEPYASNIMYYAQWDVLERLSKGKKWSFSEVRPDGVVCPSPPYPSDFLSLTLPSSPDSCLPTMR